MQLHDGQTFLLTGDSITDCGRARPVGERDGLGAGYVELVDGLLAAAYPRVRIRVLNTGIGGNRVTDLAARWSSDVLDLQPAWLSVMIGINDVWRQFDRPTDTDQVGPGRFESVYRELLARTRPRLKGLVLMTPYFLEANRSDPMRARMDEYGRIVQTLARQFDAVYVDTQAAFDRYLAHRPSASLCADRVHPNKAGHLIIASALLTELGFDWSLLGTARA
jgi:lysophospholipase L1-like esterase